MINKEQFPDPLQLDVQSILRAKAPRIPALAARALAKIVKQKELNHLLRVAFPGAGSDFSDRILKELRIKIIVKGLEDIPTGQPLLFASNHPLGGLDGITLIQILGKKYGDENIIFPVNDMLMHVRPLKNVFTPINKYGSQGRERIKTLQTVFHSNKNIIIFPAGLVSRLGKQGIRDLEWQKTFLTQALATGRTIVPIRFDATNRLRFYRLAQWRKRLHIPFNIEQIFLPAELVACRNKTFTITFLPPLDPQQIIKKYPNPRQAARHIRNSIYQNS